MSINSVQTLVLPPNAGLNSGKLWGGSLELFQPNTRAVITATPTYAKPPRSPVAYYEQSFPGPLQPLQFHPALILEAHLRSREIERVVWADIRGVLTFDTVASSGDFFIHYPTRGDSTDYPVMNITLQFYPAWGGLRNTATYTPAIPVFIPPTTPGTDFAFAIPPQAKRVTVHPSSADMVVAFERGLYKGHTNTTTWDTFSRILVTNSPLTLDIPHHVNLLRLTHAGSPGEELTQTVTFEVEL